LLIIFYIFLITAVVQWLYWIVIFAKPVFSKIDVEPLRKDSQPPVSVIICARNEADNLKNNLPDVLLQQYNLFEVIVVNDHSTDETTDVLACFQNQYSNLIVIENIYSEKKLKGKRNALLKGIEAAKNEYLIFTDADCKPVSAQWLQYMAVPFVNGKEIVIGYSPYSEENSFLNKLLRYETFFTAVQYSGFALAGMTYMATGRNMAYTKSLFLRSKNFFNKNTPASGDDDLLINELSTAENTQLVLDENSFTVSKPISTWRGWFNQKTRHYRAGFYYKPMHRLVLGLFYASWLMFYLTALLLLLSLSNYVYVIDAMFFLMFTKLLVSYLTMQRLKARTLWIYQPLFDFLLPLFLFTLGTLSLIKQSKWKNR
jgi:cellulose synthase/poly-beta-1,6-N-acetylglucosamine synthase-like glycosyltransferase